MRRARCYSIVARGLDAAQNAKRNENMRYHLSNEGGLKFGLPRLAAICGALSAIMYVSFITLSPAHVRGRPSISNVIGLGAIGASSLRASALRCPSAASSSRHHRGIVAQQRRRGYRALGFLWYARNAAAGLCAMKWPWALARGA